MSSGKKSLREQFRILGGFFFSPGEAMRELDGSSPFLAPFLLASCVAIATQLLNLPFVEKIARAGMPAGMEAEQVRHAMDLFHRSQTAAIAFSPVALLLKWLCIGGLVFLVVQVAGGIASFRQCFSLVAFSSFFAGLKPALTTLILHLRGIDRVHVPLDLMPPTGLNLLVPDSGVSTYSLLENFNIFEGLYLAILILGIAYLNRISKKKSALLIAPVWIALVSLQTALVDLTSSLQS